MLRTLALGALAAIVPAQQRPNILLIMADDMGYGDIQALNGESRIPTPNLNRLRREGMAFVDAHSGSAVCTPTRYGLLTGRYAWRGKLKRGVINGYGNPVIEDGRQTIGHLLRKAGYHTSIVGKWHLGLGWPRKAGGKPTDIDFSKALRNAPVDHGFDASYIIPASLDFPPYVYIRGRKCTTAEVVNQKGQPFPAFLRRGPRAVDLSMPDVMDHLSAEVCRQIKVRSKAAQPFFIYFPLTAPHKPTLPQKRFVGKTELGVYGDFIHQVDHHVGQCLQALRDAGVEKNTLVIYTSDNGSYMHRYRGEDAVGHVDDPKQQGYRVERHQANHIYRGTKADIYEAGHRVPFLVRWPKRVAAGSSSAATICLTDVLATCAELTGQELGEDMAEDSFSFLHHALGQEIERPRAPVIHHSANGTFAIRKGRWKLIASQGSGGRQRPRGKPFGRPFQLYDLAADPREAKNLIETETSVAVKLEAALERIRSAGRSR